MIRMLEELFLGVNYWFCTLMYTYIVIHNVFTYFKYSYVCSYVHIYNLYFYVASGSSGTSNEALIAIIVVCIIIAGVIVILAGIVASCLYIKNKSENGMYVCHVYYLHDCLNTYLVS